MKNRKLKKSVIYGVYSLCLVAMIGVIYLVESSIPKKQSNDSESNYVSKTIFDQIIPVISSEEKIVKPFNNESIKELKKYYDYKSDEKSQQDSIIKYNNIYMQSKGITYGMDDKFDVTSILDGTVEDIKEDDILGKVVVIKHNDSVSSLYQCLGETTIQKGDNVITGQVIGQSGTCNLNKELNNSLYFELIAKNETVNPNDYYGKTLKEIG